MLKKVTTVYLAWDKYNKFAIKY